MFLGQFSRPRQSFSPLAALAALCLLVSGCSANNPGRPQADPVVAQLVAALSNGSFDGLPLAGDPQAAIADYEQTTAGLDGLLPKVEAGAPSYSRESSTASVPLVQHYELGAATWTFNTTASLSFADGLWRVDWAPSLLHPDLTPATRLVHERTPARRADIHGADGTAIVWQRPVYRVGIDKTLVPPELAETSAARLAPLLGIDVDNYVTQVRNAGPRAFVIGLTVREGQVPVEIDDIPGALAQPGVMPLAPTSTWASGVIGTVREATADDIKAGQGAVAAGDFVGQSGLQKKYDEQLRGVPGHTIWLSPRPTAAIPSAGPSASASVSVPSTPKPTASAPPRKQLFTLAPVQGPTLNTTISEPAQTRAEEVLADVGGIAALVVLDARTGAILAAADSPASGANGYALKGQYAPGSTFKVSSTLALLRKGLDGASPVSCPPTATVDGTTIKNVTGYSRTGTISLLEAVAYSCNTAFVTSAVDTLGNRDLGQAAASLGIGLDYDGGFDAFYGRVPDADSATARAVSAIGQGKVLASPMVMAAQAASVSQARTIVPYLLTDTVPTSSAAPLTEAEGAQLQLAMEGVVNIGSGASLRGLVTGAKSGTAEFKDSSGADKQHAWMIAYNDQYAFAAVVYDGESGARSAAPLIAAFLE